MGFGVHPCLSWDAMTHMSLLHVVVLHKFFKNFHLVLSTKHSFFAIKDEVFWQFYPPLNWWGLDPEQAQTTNACPVFKCDLKSSIKGMTVIVKVINVNQSVNCLEFM